MIARSLGLRALLALLVSFGTAPSALAQRLPSATPEEAGFSAARLARVTAALADYVRDGRLPGAVVYVARGGRVVLDEAVGFRDVEAGAPMASDDLFRIASQTKAVVSVAVMMLQEEGRLLIDDPVSRHLPEYARTTVAVPLEGGGYEVVPARRAITLRDLLTHTAGVGYGGGPGADAWRDAGITGWYFAHRDEPVRETVRRIAALPMPAQPGERWVYGYATDILGAVVEEVSGVTLDAFLRSRIFEPLGMHDTRFFVPPAESVRLATVYSLRSGRPLKRAPDGAGMEAQGQYVEGPRASYSGGAGLVSTARDYGRFLQMLLDGGSLDDVRILEPGTVAVMTRDHVGDLYGGAASGFGLGFSVTLDAGAEGVPGSVGTYGWGGAYHSTYWVDPAEQLVVVYLTQVIPATGLDDFARVRALVYEAIVAPPRRRRNRSRGRPPR